VSHNNELSIQENIMDNESVKALITELVEVMEGSKLSELEVELEGARIRLQKEAPKTKSEIVTVTAAQPMNAAHVMAAPGTVASVGVGAADNLGEDGNYKHIDAVMVGTFYAASAPDADPYVEVGDVINEETVVCIIEAMKVMNEIKAEMSGKVIEVLVNNGEPVEYGQPLFLIDPSVTS
jgi:acetyl-CoA carboxylase biotin carboxyl carrier protein